MGTPQVDEPGAIPMFVDESRVFVDQNDHTWVVVHKTAGGSSAQNIAGFFASDPNMASTHYVVGQDGAVVQCVQEKDGAAGNCCTSAGCAAYRPTDVNLNLKTVSIEHVDPSTDNSTPLTDAQKAASFKLIKDICSRHNIPIRSGDATGGVIGHNDIDPINRALCPNNYPWAELWAYLQEGETVSITLSTPGISEYFVADGAVWKCKQTGFLIGGGILSFYQSFGGNALCGLTHLGLPLSNEISIGEGRTYQRFQRGVAFYDPAHTNDSPPGAGAVYLGHIDSGAGQDPRIATLEAQITTLQAQLKAGQNAALQAELAALQGKLKQILVLAQ